MAADSATARRFEIALSFPGEHRDFVQKVADALAEQFGRAQVLYDHYHKAEFARPGLSVYLPGLYRKQAELIVIFLCPEYPTKLWCRLEWRHIHELISTVHAHRIMFLSFGDPGDLSDLGILGGDGYIDLTRETPEQTATEILTRWSLERRLPIPKPVAAVVPSAGVVVAKRAVVTPLPVSAGPAWSSAHGKDEYGEWAEFSVKGVVQRMRWIPPGEFLMGSPESERERFDSETQHRVILKQGYWLADTACTQALWQAVMGNNPSSFKDDPRNPVEQVSWDDVVKDFLPKLNALVPELAAELPTEAQWEYACRAGTQTAFWFGDQIGTDQVNYDGRYPMPGGTKGQRRQYTVPVKALPANGWGLYQMHGNVWEWCSDWSGDYEPGVVADPRGPGTGQGRVLRGGGWIYDARDCRSAYRFANVPGDRDDFIGFRLSRGLAAPGAEP